MTHPLRLCAAVVAAAITLVACGSGAATGDATGHTPVSALPTVAGGSSSPVPGVTASGVVASTPIAATNFGMHVQRLGSWPTIPIGAFRIWNADSTWGALERSPGSWDFDALDQRVQLAERSNAEILLVLSMPPAWAASRPDLKSYGGSPSMPTDLDAWRGYVRTVAERYAGRIEAYEIWNEPNLVQFWAGSAEQLATLTETAAEEIRAADDGALVVSPGLSARTSGSTQFFSLYAGALSPAAIDVVGMHIYPYPGDGPESMVELSRRFRELADAAGLAGKPIWNTEIGYGRTPDQLFSGDVAAGLVLRTYLVLPSLGIDRNYWYMWDDRGFIGLYLVGADRVTPSESGNAYAAAQRWLVGAGLVGCTAAGQRWSCELVKDGVRVQILWCVGGEQPVEVPAGATVMYPFQHEPAPVTAGTTVALGDLPVLFSPVPIAGLTG